MGCIRGKAIDQWDTNLCKENKCSGKKTRVRSLLACGFEPKCQQRIFLAKVIKCCWMRILWGICWSKQVRFNQLYRGKVQMCPKFKWRPFSAARYWQIFFISTFTSWRKIMAADSWENYFFSKPDKIRISICRFQTNRYPSKLTGRQERNKRENSDRTETHLERFSYK